MSPPVMFVAALVLLPAIGLVIWAGLSMAQFEEDLGAFSAFESVHFEIGHPAPDSAEAAKWPISG